VEEEEEEEEEEGVEDEEDGAASVVHSTQSQSFAMSEGASTVSHSTHKLILRNAAFAVKEFPAKATCFSQASSAPFFVVGC
jgi:CO dehydrogenase/acetyl-CoA synthase beta subunit